MKYIISLIYAEEQTQKEREWTDTAADIMMPNAAVGQTKEASEQAHQKQKLVCFAGQFGNFLKST